MESEYAGLVVCDDLFCVVCRHSEALKFYEAALGSEPTSVVLWKRKVAVFKAMGDNVRAVNELNALLAV